MIDNIGIANFKPFNEKGIKLKFGKITLLIGENGTGKSSVLQTLSLLKQSCGADALKEGDFKYLSYKDLVHNGEAEGNISFTLEGDSFLNIPRIENESIHYNYKSEFANPGNLVFQEGTINIGNSYSFFDRDIFLTEILGRYYKGEYKNIPSAVNFDDSSIKLTATNSILRPINASGGHISSNMDRTIYEDIQNIIKSILLIFEQSIKDTYTDFSFRGFNEQVYPLKKLSTETITEPDDIMATFAYNSDILHKVARYLQEITGTSLNIKLVPGPRIELKDQDNFSIYHGGFGTNQLIRPLLMLSTSPKGSLIAIEEPETSLHPKAQLNLCDVFTSIAYKENKQIVITTHNEHILTGFLNLVAEDKIKPSDLTVYYFSRIDKMTDVSELVVRDDGSLDGGLRGFFEVSMNSYQRHLKAIKRKSKTS